MLHSTLESTDIAQPQAVTSTPIRSTVVYISDASNKMARIPVAYANSHEQELENIAVLGYD